MFRNIKRVHFVGIGGIGMSGIAEVLLNLGFEVTGSDIATSEITRRLKKLGAKIMKEHKALNVFNSDVVVYSSAVKRDNVELVRAQELKIPVIPRAEMLAELMRIKKSIAVAGTHGKTTVTSLIGSILSKASFDPTIVVGGKLRSLNTNAKLGKGEYLVCEADESDKSFLKLLPTFAIITTIDEEHLDNYKDIEEIKNTFLAFSQKVPFYGCVILCLDEQNVQSILPDIKRRTITYGFSRQADISAVDIEIDNFHSHFTVVSGKESIARIDLNIPGRHNIQNALAAIAMCLELDVDPEKIKESLSEFHGVRRRFEIKGKINGIWVVDDYAHHPREIEVTLESARGGWGGRIISIFQPHLFSRTLKLKDRFGTSFNEADKVIITDVYPSRESPIPGVSGKLIYEAIRDHGHRSVTYIKDKENIVSYLMKETRKGDLVITIGAGDIYKMGEKFIRKKGGKVLKDAYL
ncbi:MAG: UDP-N-acetylmuramate--L-alanine ligase [Candidatus Cloacimonadota bacterium]|nr:MAG: UDP-N-acetylmuramate--L-alanine ligase [Candidatus Cloacimonadota bacterium]